MYHFTFDCPDKIHRLIVAICQRIQLITQGWWIICFDLLAHSKLSKYFSKICVSVNSGSIVNVAPNRDGWQLNPTENLKNFVSERTYKSRIFLCT